MMFYEIIRRKVMPPDRAQMAIWRMSVAYWLEQEYGHNTDTHTHS
jgi:hypothetical protein